MTNIFILHLGYVVYHQRTNQDENASEYEFILDTLLWVQLRLNQMSSDCFRHTELNKTEAYIVGGIFAKSFKDDSYSWD